MGAMAVNAGYADQVMSMASSHFATAEKQFRFPLAYGNQRPPSATWTVTGCGAVVLAGNRKDGMARIAGITTGRMVDMGAKDSMNMGAAMAPAAFHTIEQNLEDFQVNETWYDKIITGDLGEVGRTILLEFMKNKGRDLSQLHMDCGMRYTIRNSRTPIQAEADAAVPLSPFAPTSSPRYRTAHGSGFYLSPQVPCCPRSASMKDRAYRALPMQSSLNI